MLTLCVRRYTRDDGHALVDIYDSGYAGYILCYVFMGILDAMWQTTSYWLMGAMSNDPAKLAFLTGFCTFLPLFSKLKA